MTLPRQFSFTHYAYDKDKRRLVTFNPTTGRYDELCTEEDGGTYTCQWDVKEIERFLNPADPFWLNVQPVLPEGKFAFNHADGEAYFGEVKGDKLHVTWEGTRLGAEGCEYALDGGPYSAYDNFLSGAWVLNGFKVSGTPAEAPAPVPSEVEQLISVATEALYDLTFQPSGKIGLRGIKYGSRTVTLGSVSLALQWFDLMAQLKTLESGGEDEAADF